MKKQAGLHLSQERIICMLVVDDGLSDLILGQHVGGFVRAWVIRDRTSNELYMKYRFKYPTSPSPTRSWYVIRPQDQGDFGENHLRCMLEDILQKSARTLGHGKINIDCYYPPAGCTPDQTLQWLVEQDLVEPVGFEGAA